MGDQPDSVRCLVLPSDITTPGYNLRILSYRCQWTNLTMKDNESLHDSHLDAFSLCLEGTGKASYATGGWSKFFRYELPELYSKSFSKILNRDLASKRVIIIPQNQL